MPRPPRELTPERSPSHQLGAELRAYRVKNGHTQKSLGKKVHVSPSMIGAIETGDRISTADVIKACDNELEAAGELCKLWSIAAQSRRRAGRPATSAPVPTATPVAQLDPTQREAARAALERGVMAIIRGYRGKPHQLEECLRTDRQSGAQLVLHDPEDSQQGAESHE